MSRPATEIERPIRVLVVEDHPVLRGLVRMACEASDHLEVVAEAATGAEALAALSGAEPHVVVLDLTLPDIDGLEVARRLREGGSPARILVLTGRTDDQTLFAAMRAGVDGYLEKSSGVRSIADVLERVAKGERVFTEEQERAALGQLGKLVRVAREASGVAGAVTSREIEILQYVSYGLTMRQVANRLGLSPRTVEAHVAKLYRKLGVSNRVQAVSRAVSLGLIDLS